jgi:hypothetical protein
VTRLKSLVARERVMKENVKGEKRGDVAGDTAKWGVRRVKKRQSMIQEKQI